MNEVREKKVLVYNLCMLVCPCDSKPGSVTQALGTTP